MALQLRDHAVVCARRFNPSNCHGDWRLRGVLVLLMPVVFMIITTANSGVTVLRAHQLARAAMSSPTSSFTSSTTSPTVQVVRSGHTNNQACAAHYGQKAGDPVCCSQHGALGNDHEACQSSTYPTCEGFMQGHHMGKCSSGAVRATSPTVSHPCLSTMLERDSLAVLPAAAAESVGLAAEAAAGGRAVELRAPGPAARLLPVPVLRATLRRPTLRARSALALHSMFARNLRPYC